MDAVGQLNDFSFCPHPRASSFTFDSSQRDCKSDRGVDAIVPPRHKRSLLPSHSTWPHPNTSSINTAQKVQLSLPSPQFIHFRSENTTLAPFKMQFTTILALLASRLGFLRLCSLALSYDIAVLWSMPCQVVMAGARQPQAASPSPLALRPPCLSPPSGLNPRPQSPLV